MSKKSAAQKKQTATGPQRRVPQAAPDSGALGQPSAEESALASRSGADMPENDSTMHTGLHDGHDAEQHFDGEVHDDLFPLNWAPPAELDAPPPRAGMVQRWVRLSLKGQADANNVKAQERQGWRPRTLESVPEGDRRNYPTMKDPRSTGTFLVNKDLVLCEMPKRLFDQMAAYYKQKRLGQVEALVDQPLAGAAIKGAERHGFGAPHVAERHTEVRTDRIPIVAADR